MALSADSSPTPNGARSYSVDIRELSFHWRGQTSPVIDIPLLQIPPAQRVFLHGPSGSGKSTLLSLLAGVHTPQHGRIEIHQHRLNELSQSRRDRFRADYIGYIFQQFNLLPFLDLIHNVTLACEFSAKRRQYLAEHNKSARDEASRLLTRLGIAPELHHRAASQLSVGQQQRVAAARALIGAPALVIADEPTSALDADSREDFLQLLFEECAATKSTLMFVSHDSTLASMFDRSVSLLDINRAATAATRGVS